MHLDIKGYVALVYRLLSSTRFRAAYTDRHTLLLQFYINDGVKCDTEQKLLLFAELVDIFRPHPDSPPVFAEFHKRYSKVNQLYVSTTPLQPPAANLAKDCKVYVVVYTCNSLCSLGIHWLSSLTAASPTRVFITCVQLGGDDRCQIHMRTAHVGSVPVQDLH